MRDNTVLVVVDPTAGDQPALTRGAWLAKTLGASLELFVCDYDQSLASYPKFDAKGLEKARASRIKNHVTRLESLARPLREQGLEVAVDARWGRPLHRGIVQKVVETRPRLVVKDTHSHPVLKRTLLSNTDWSLIRSCPAPLLLVKPRAVGAPPKVLAAVDPLHERDKPAELDRALLTFARELATAVGGELHVLHAFDVAPVIAAAAASPTAPTVLPVSEITDALESERRKALERLLEGFPIDPANVHLTEGAAHRCIEQAAEEGNFDFVVMGAVSRSALQRIILGSTAERALDRLPCDLIVVKRPGFEAPEVD